MFISEFNGFKENKIANAISLRKENVPITSPSTVNKALPSGLKSAQRVAWDEFVPLFLYLSSVFDLGVHLYSCCCKIRSCLLHQLKCHATFYVQE